MPNIVIRPLDIEKDCAQLAELFNASEPAWPEGFTNGIPLTAEAVREWLQNERYLTIYVAEADGKIVGCATFMEGTPWPSGLYDAGYLDLLNVHPDYHGLSIGRRLIQATIERSVQEGWPFQTLGTWSANFKAVPAYKKTGHFWRPKTSVWMENFIPGALQMPLAKPFFERHDWYACYVRTIDQQPDDEHWEGLKVYTQHWEADGESLTIWIDREALAPCGIETDEVLIAAIPQELEPLQGTTTWVRWRIHNKRTEPLRVHIHAMGADGLEIDHREGFVVPPELSTDHAAQVKVSENAPRSKLNGAAPAVRTIITLGHNEVELFAGMRPRKPFSITLAPRQISLWPGQPLMATLELHSEIEKSTRGVLLLTPSDGLALENPRQEITLSPKGHVGIPLRMQAGNEGVYKIRAHWEPEEASFKALRETFDVFCVAPGGIQASCAQDEIRMESDTLRVTITARNGYIRLEDKANERRILQARPLIGPPHSPGEFDRRHFRLGLEKAKGAVAYMEGEPEHYPDVCMRLEVALTPTGLLDIKQTLTCQGANPFQGARIGLATMWGQREASILTTPLKAGYIRAPAVDYPTYGEAPRQPEEYAEPWIAVENAGLAGGVAWSETIAQINHANDLTLLGAPLTLQPGECTTQRYALWGGHGDWHTAREHLLRWAGQPRNPQQAPKARPITHARLARSILATTHDTIQIQLSVDSVSPRKGEAEITLTSPDGVKIAPAKISIPALTRENPLTANVTLSVPPQVGVYRGHLSLTHSRGTHTTAWQVLRLGHDHPVTVTPAQDAESPLWIIENGAARIIVAPHFGPSVISWHWQGKEMLFSAYPEPCGFAWTFPWYGGIHLTLRPLDNEEACGLLVRERFKASPFSHVDGQGLPWKGVRLHTRPENQEIRDLEITLDYLTLGQSPILQVVYRVHNLRPTRQTVHIGGWLTFSLGHTLSELVLQGEAFFRQPTPWGSHYTNQQWGLLTHPASGMSLLAVNPQGRLSLDDFARHGRVLGINDRITLEGNATEETVLYLLLADTPEEALAFQSLAELRTGSLKEG